MTTNVPSELPWRYAVPAWLMSLIVHLASFLILATVIQATKKPILPEADRTAQIVLFRPTAESRPQYFQQAALKNAPALNASVNDNVKTSVALPNAQDVPALTSVVSLPESGPLPPIGELGVVQSPVTGSGKRKFSPTSSADEQFVADEQSRLARDRKALGPTTSVAIFGSKALEGRSFVFVIDRSKSMGSEGLNAIDAAAKELVTGLSKLTEQHQFQIIAYNHATHFLSERKMLAATDENKQSIKKFFVELAAFGGTEHELAVSAALGLKPDVVFLLTDGGDPELNQGQLQWIRQQAGTRTVIHCLQFGHGPLQESDNFLMKMARQNGGTFRYVDMAKR